MRTTEYSDAAVASGQDRKQPTPAILQAKRLRQRQKRFIWAARILFIVGFLGIWQLASSGQFVDPIFFSSPLDIAARLGTWFSDGSLWFNVEITLQEILFGLFFGVTVGILVGFLFGIQPTLEKIFSPFIIIFNSVPKITLAPLFIIWFGVDIPMKVLLASLTVFFLIFLNTLEGVRNVDQGLVNAVRLMGGKFWDISLKVILPSAIGSVLTGLHIAIPYALIGAVIAEQIASNRGVGFLIQSSGGVFDTTGVFAALVVLTVIAGILNALVNLIDRRTSHWKANLKVGGEKIAV